MAKLTMKAARVNVGLSQKSAAESLRVSNKTLGSWEAGKSFPKANQIIEICELYGISYDDLIFLTDNPL